jgi:hypothetical protein
VKVRSKIFGALVVGASAAALNVVGGTYKNFKGPFSARGGQDECNGEDLDS